MKVLGIEHVGIAVESFEKDAPFWQLLLKYSDNYSEEVKDQKVNTNIFATGNGKVELLEATAPDSPIAKFIDKRGKGIHHICLHVEDIVHALIELELHGVELIDKVPRVGAEGYLIAFIHPKSTGGVLVELAEKPIV